MTTFAPSYLWDGLRALIKASETVPCKGMAIKYVSDLLGVKIDQRTSGRGVVFLVKGPGWRYTLVNFKGECVIERMSGTPADIEQSFTLARIAA